MGKKAIYYKNNPARVLKCLSLALLGLGWVGLALNLHSLARAGKFQLGLNTSKYGVNLINHTHLKMGQMSQILMAPLRVYWPMITSKKYIGTAPVMIKMKYGMRKAPPPFLKHR